MGLFLLREIGLHAFAQCTACQYMNKGVKLIPTYKRMNLASSYGRKEGELELCSVRGKTMSSLNFSVIQSHCDMHDSVQNPAE